MSATGVFAHRLRALRGSQFARAGATLAAGQGLGALVPILTAPILGRLYRPADYGALATYMAVATVLASAAALQMQNAVIAERGERRAIGLVSVCMAAAAGVSLVAAAISLGLIIFYRNDPVWSGLTGWLVLLPVTTFLAGTTAGIAALANRRSRYGFMARVQVVAVIAAAVVSIAMGYCGAGAHGLFAGYFLQQGVTFAAHVRILRSMPDFRTDFRIRRLRALAHRHTGFAIFTLPTEIISQLNQALPVFALSGLGATATLGAFNRARQLVMMPFNLLGGSIAQVFRQRAAAQYNATGSCRDIYVKTFFALLALGAPPILVLLAIAPTLFTVVLGPNWTEAGEIARILAPTFLLKLICSPLATIFYFQNLQREDFILGLMSAALSFIAVGGAWIWSRDAIVTIAAFSASSSTSYLVYIVRGWIHSKRGARPCR